ncbi:hypothetical protein [Aquimarina algiphila]|uniref:DUF4840 domain-containing protein n=1 Tax=Aquimarina algiphila TaxID=2047982 RepID=A0A554VR95_9FLAO|nr:hypothetical protein [Aquimarina algiphila]TSE11133.1 hypothetical protein FOF46_02585 [Aquimarina algiphila]
MKKIILCFFVVTSLAFIACQEEERELITPAEDTTIPKNSQLAGLMKNIVTHDGSYDDVVDNANCFSINLPYTILLNGNEVIIDQIDDYDNLSNSDVIEIQFPITITLLNHQEEPVASQLALAVFAGSCKSVDDDIECIDFIYPVQFSTFDSNTNQLQTVDIDHDAVLFRFMSDLNDNTSVSINYPIDLLLHNGEKVDAQHNEELLSSIMDVASACDENDN